MNHENGLMQRQNGSGKTYVTYKGAQKKMGAIGGSQGRGMGWKQGLLVLSFVLSLVAIFSMEYYAFYGIQYLEAQTKKIKRPYASSGESNADLERMKGVKEAMKHAWKGYETYAWGSDELLPKSKRGKSGVLGSMNGFSGFAASIVDAMSTLHLMGLEAEFAHARDWVAENMTFATGATQQVSFFETTIRLLGGLLSAHDLSRDDMFLEKANDLGSRLVNAFAGTRSGILLNEARLPNTEAVYSRNDVLLAEIGTNLVEFATLAARTGNETYRIRAEAGLRFLHAKYPDDPLLGTSVARNTGDVRDSMRSVGTRTDSYYEYLLKYWILGNKKDDHWRQRWEDSVDTALEELKVTSKNGLYTFMGTKRSKNSAPDSSVTHLGCFYPGSVALGVISGAVTGEKAEKYLDFAKSMMHACFQLYNATATGLGADEIFINMQTEEISNLNRPYLQRPEVVESMFYLWRATHDRMYRDWGWSVVEALNQYCKQEAGYSGLVNANVIPPMSDDSQQSWFLAETLKYLYLLFSDDGALNLDEWVFNTEAHPVRARKVEESYWIDWDFVENATGKPGLTDGLKSSVVSLEQFFEQLSQPIEIE
eukprot:jgi/Picre1/28174/NNA_003580.t1